MKKFNWVNRAPFTICFWSWFYDNYAAGLDLVHLSREEFEKHLEKCPRCQGEVEKARERVCNPCFSKEVYIAAVRDRLTVEPTYEEFMEHLSSCSRCYNQIRLVFREYAQQMDREAREQGLPDYGP